MRKIIIIFLFLICSVNLFGQKEEAEYKVNIIGGLGYGVFMTDLDTEGMNKSGFNGSIRFMWEPEHLLRLGIETGYLQFYSLSQSNVDTEYGKTDIESRLTAIPFLFMFSMEIFENFELNIGNGFYSLTSTVDSYGNKVSSTQLSTGLLVSGSYYYALNESLSLGGEVKWNYVQKINDGSLSLQFLIKYAIVRY